MSCNTCGKSFSILRKEHGCPNCGFSYCSSCLKHKTFVSKINAEAKVCSRCSAIQNDSTSTKQIVHPPDILLKRLKALEKTSSEKVEKTTHDYYQKMKHGLAPEDQQIVDRLRQLAEKPQEGTNGSTEDQIAERLKKLRGEDNVSKCTEGEIRERLAKLKGETSRSFAYTLPPADLRSDQEKSEDLMRQYMEEAKIDSSNKEAFNGRIKEIEARLHSLSGTKSIHEKQDDSESESEEDIVKRIMEKAKMEAERESKTMQTSDGEFPPADVTADNGELPWCEICNEDAVMRCLGCRYLFCKTCFNEHRDDDDGCNRYEPYKKPKMVPV